jgi:hypothetical protein
MIGDFVTVPGTQNDVPECHVSCKHLVEMSTLAMSFSTRFQCGSKTEWPQLLNDVSHVIIKITANDYRSIGVLLYDVSHDFGDSFSPFFQVLLFTRLEIAVDNLNICVAEL